MKSMSQLWFAWFCHCCRAICSRLPLLHAISFIYCVVQCSCCLVGRAHKCHDSSIACISWKETPVQQQKQWQRMVSNVFHLLTSFHLAQSKFHNSVVHIDLKRLKRSHQLGEVVNIWKVILVKGAYCVHFIDQIGFALGNWIIPIYEYSTFGSHSSICYLS